jgi:hypothetical protein
VASREESIIIDFPATFKWMISEAGGRIGMNPRMEM